EGRPPSAPYPAGPATRIGAPTVRIRQREMDGDSGVQSERRAIDRAAEGRTICSVFADTVREHGPEPALSWKHEGSWRFLTWRAYRDAVAEVAAGLHRI